MTTATKIPTSFMGYKANADENMTSIRDLVAENDMNYGVDKVQATYKWDGKERISENQFQLCRNDNGNDLSNQTVTKTYKVLTPNDIADDFQWFVDQGYARPFSAFTTSTGIESIALILDPDLFQGVNGYTGFILGQNRQGQVGAKGQLFVYRQVCKNGMMGWAKEAGFSISHRGDVKQKFTDHTREWARMEQTFHDMNRRMTELSGVPMTFEQFTAATDALHGTRLEGDTVIDVKTLKPASTRKLNIRETILSATDMPLMGTSGSTAADWYNGVTWRLSHLLDGSSRSKTAQTDSLLNGSGRSEELRALAILDRFTKTGAITASK
jgi:hypothetical protein